MKTFLFLLLLIPALALGINEPTAVGGSAAGLGGISSMDAGAWSGFNNPALLSVYKTTSFGLAFSNRYGIKQLSSKYALSTLPHSSGVFGIKLSQFGYSQYNETTAGLAFGKTLGKKLSAGLSLNYYRIFIAGDYGSKGLFSFDAGIYSKLNDKISLGAIVYNPYPITYGESFSEEMPSIARLGFAYQISENIQAFAEAEKNQSDKNMRFGFDYQPLKTFHIRLGTGIKPSTYCFGLGYEWGKWHVDMAFETHPVLGPSPALSLVYSPKKKTAQ